MNFCPNHPGISHRFLISILCYTKSRSYQARFSMTLGLTLLFALTLYRHVARGRS